MPHVVYAEYARLCVYLVEAKTVCTVCLPQLTKEELGLVSSV
jgi:hypothetical protein